MKRALLFGLFLLITCFSHAQITITAADMPKPGDTLRTSITTILEGFDYQSAGENFLWDFSALTVLSQRVDTFVSVSSTPMIYQAVFNNQFFFPDYKATVAKKINEFGLIPGLEIADAYQFFKETTAEYREVGAGVTIAGTALPIMYEQIDTLYRFPMVYGNLDSSNASFNIDIPDLGYAGFIKKRVNTADGWGILVTPYGEYQALRVRTDIHEYDSIYVDSLSTGFPLTRNYTEYKWFANGFCLPLLTVTEEAFLVTATYVDSVRYSYTEVDDLLAENEFSFNVFPNPAQDYLSVTYELLAPSKVKMNIYPIDCRSITKIMDTQQDHGLYNQLINIRDAGLLPGLYLLVLEIDNRPFVKRFLLQ